ncbi:restriction endonuclease subunit S [Psychrobacter sp.]|uniref:restriction endonuclease subunit S n=1 Tax=Psychrobacter sp. TaxID=56811 RepID=UPI003BB0F2B4
MASNWEEMCLDEVTELIIDCPHSTPKWMDEGVVVLRSNNIKNGRLDLSSPSFTNEEGYQARVKRAIPESGDLVLTREAPMGEVCQIPEGLRCCLGQRMVLLRVKKEIMDSTFLLFALQSPYLQHQISWNEGTGTTVSNIRMPNIKAFQIPTPTLPEQKAIAHILGSLDNKIELNRQMNETLEAMAQALFKSWFVDFDPVIDNALAAGNAIPDEFAERAEMRKGIEKKGNSDIEGLFPDEFEFTEEMGWIPKGWGISEVQGFGQVVCGKTPSKKKAEYYGNDISFIKIPDMHHVAWATTTIDNLSFEGSNSQKNKLIPKGSICVSCIATVGKVLITSREAHTNQQINSLIPAEKNTLYYLYSSFLGMEKSLQDLASGGAVTLNLNTSNFSKIKLIFPANPVLDAYDSSVSSLYEKNLKSLIQNQELAKLRDTLLPKLMSGELRIADAAALVDEVL